MDKTTTAASYSASIGTAAAGIFSLNEWALLLGIIFAAATFVINWHYQYKRDMREHKKHCDDADHHKLRMELLKQEQDELQATKGESDGQ